MRFCQSFLPIAVSAIFNASGFFQALSQASWKAVPNLLAARSIISTSFSKVSCCILNTIDRILRSIAVVLIAVSLLS